MAKERLQRGMAAVIVAMLGGCATPDISSTFQVWGHELAHCVYGAFHDETYIPWRMEFNMVRKEFYIRVVTFSDYIGLQAAYEAKTGRASEGIKGFQYMSGDVCVVGVHEIVPL